MNYFELLENEDKNEWNNNIPIFNSIEELK